VYNDIMKINAIPQFSIVKFRVRCMIYLLWDMVSIRKRDERPA
jgi:hypothetical protein